MGNESINQNMMSREEKDKKRKEVQERTFEETYSLLMKNKKCIMIRPTGFGKTFIMIKIAELGIWDKVFFVYPRNVIKDATIDGYKEKLKNIDTDFISYSKLGQSVKDESLLKRLGWYKGKKVLFLFDEAHFCGASTWYDAVKKIEDMFPEFYYLGATATPDRLDKIDVVQDIFGGVKPYRYTRHRAIVDGIFNKIIYVAGSFNIQHQLQEEGRRRINNQKLLEGNPSKKAELLEYLDRKVLEYARYDDQSDLIRDKISEFIEDRDYMKFLVYYPTIKILESKQNEVHDWFAKAFPDMIVEDSVVVKGNKKVLDKILSLERVEGKIDLIMCIDMISYGYHVDDLTGEVMLRLTRSDALLNQQVGRCYSIVDNSKKILFDFIGNLSVTPYGVFKGREGLLDGMSDVISPGDSQEDIDIIDNDGNIIYGDDGVLGSDDLIVVDTDVVNIDEELRFCNIDEVAMEKAVVRALKYKNMPREVAIRELKSWGVVDDDSLDKVIRKYEKVV